MWHSKTRGRNSELGTRFSSACLQHAFDGRRIQAIMRNSTVALDWQHTRDANNSSAMRAKRAGHGRVSMESYLGIYIQTSKPSLRKHALWASMNCEKL
jgi:hypothetical protein